MEYIITAVVIVISWPILKRGLQMGHEMLQLTPGGRERARLEEELKGQEEGAEIVAKKAALLNEILK